MNHPRTFPASMIVALLALIIVVLARSVLTALALFAGTLLKEPVHLIQAGLAGVVTFLLFWGFYVGHRLAWQWGRLAGLLGAVLMALPLVVLLTMKNTPPGAGIMVLLLLLHSIPLLILYFALGRASAMEHFSLRCPACTSTKTRAADFLFRKAKCVCGNVW